MKKIVLEFQFEEVTEFPDEDAYLEATRIVRHPDTDLIDEDELMGIGETVAQTDTWQVDRWIDIQEMLSSNTDSVDWE